METILRPYANFWKRRHGLIMRRCGSFDARDVCLTHHEFLAVNEDQRLFCWSSHWKLALVSDLSRLSIKRRLRVTLPASGRDCPEEASHTKPVCATFMRRKMTINGKRKRREKSQTERKSEEKNQSRKKEKPENQPSINRQKPYSVGSFIFNSYLIRLGFNDTNCYYTFQIANSTLCLSTSIWLSDNLVSNIA